MLEGNGAAGVGAIAVGVARGAREGTGEGVGLTSDAVTGVGLTTAGVSANGEGDWCTAAVQAARSTSADTAPARLTIRLIRTIMADAPVADSVVHELCGVTSAGLKLRALVDGMPIQAMRNRYCRFRNAKNGQALMSIREIAGPVAALLRSPGRVATRVRLEFT